MSPQIRKDEDRQAFIQRCVRELKHEDPKRPTKECLGECYGRWDSAQKKDKGKGEKE